MASFSPFIRRLAVALNLITFLGYLIVCVPLVRAGLPANADFTAFYTGWKIARERQNLYDLDTQRRYQAEDSSEPLFLPYLNPPHVTLPFAPLSTLPRPRASGVWLLVQFGLLAYFLHALWRATERWDMIERVLMLSTVAASPFVINSLLNGAFSIAVALGLLKWCRAVRADEGGKGGLWLLLASVKPQLVILPLAASLGGKSWRGLASFACGSAALAAVSLGWLGWRSWPDYFRVLRTVAAAPAGFSVFAEKMPNLKSAVVLLGIPHPNAVAFAALTFGAIVTFLLWRSRRHPPGLLAAFTISSGLLLSPHLNIQDGLSLAVPATLLYDHLRQNELPRKAFAYFAVGVPTLANASLLLDFMAAYWRLPLLLIIGLTGWVVIHLYLAAKRARA